MGANSRQLAPRGRQPAGYFFFPPDGPPMVFVKRWVVEWRDGDGKAFALGGGDDFAADLGAAVEAVNRNNPEFISSINLWPGKKPCPVRVYSLALQTVRAFKDEMLWRHWSDVFDDVEFELPDVFELFSINRTGVKF